MCYTEDVSVEQMTFGGKHKVGPPKIANRKIGKSIRFKQSVLREMEKINLGPTQFFEQCYESSKTAQPRSYLRTNYDRKACQSIVKSGVSDDLWGSSMKASAIMSIFNDCDRTGLVESGP